MSKQIEAMRHEIFLVLIDTESELSDGAKKALNYVMNGLEAMANQESAVETPQQPATYTCGVCGVSMQMEQSAQAQPK